jgi:hypothetical protein
MRKMRAFFGPVPRSGTRVRGGPAWAEGHRAEISASPSARSSEKASPNTRRASVSPSSLGRSIVRGAAKLRQGLRRKVLWAFGLISAILRPLSHPIPTEGLFRGAGVKDNGSLNLHLFYSRGSTWVPSQLPGGGAPACFCSLGGWPSLGAAACGSGEVKPAAAAGRSSSPPRERFGGAPIPDAHGPASTRVASQHRERQHREDPPPSSSRVASPPRQSASLGRR